MAKKQDLPDFREKRKILFGAKTSPDKMRKTGELFLDAQRYDDALEFFERADAEDLVRRIAVVAMDGGDTPLYMRAKKILKEEITEQEWTDLAAEAEKAGILSAAYVAHLKAGHEAEAARLDAMIRGPQPGEPKAIQQEQESEPGATGKESEPDED